MAASTNISALIQHLRKEGSPNPSVVTANAVSQQLLSAKDSEAAVPSLSVFMLRTSTIEPVRPFLDYHLCRCGFLPKLNFSGYNDWRALSNSDRGALYAAKPDIVVLFLRLEELSPRLAQGFAGLSGAEIAREKELVHSDIEQTVSAIRSRCQAKILVHNFPLIGSPALGAADAMAPVGQNETIDHLNHALRRVVAGQPETYVFDYRVWSAGVGLNSLTDRRLWLTARVPLSGKVLSSLALEYVRYFMAVVSPRRKCLAVDLDNTLWGGILGEDGYDGIQIGHEFPGNAFRELQQAVLDLHHRGIILAICSKNNEAEVRRVLEQHPDMLLRPQHFASLQINWDDKATNLRRIAQELNIGLDSLVFWDDNPAERSLVRQILPEVLVIDLPDHPSEYAPALRRILEFETLALSDEDRQRGGMYRAQVERQRLQASAESLESYYASLDMHLEIGQADSYTIPRIAQLTQKTNQFNLTTRRYSEAEIVQMAADSNWRIYYLRLKDRFGDNGISGMAILHNRDGGTWEIDTFLLSCRILGRTVETAFLAFLLRQAKESGGTQLEGWFVPTKRNAPAKEVYAQHGFDLAKENEGGSLWRLPLTNNMLTMPIWFTMDAKEVLSANH